MILRRAKALLIAASFALPACGGLSTGKVPVDSEMKPWEAPDEDELVGSDDDDGDDDDMEDEEPEPEPAAGAASAE